MSNNTYKTNSLIEIQEWFAKAGLPLRDGIKSVIEKEQWLPKVFFSFKTREELAKTFNELERSAIQEIWIVIEYYREHLKCPEETIQRPRLDELKQQDNTYQNRGSKRKSPLNDDIENIDPESKAKTSRKYSSKDKLDPSSYSSLNFSHATLKDEEALFFNYQIVMTNNMTTLPDYFTQADLIESSNDYFNQFINNFPNKQTNRIINDENLKDSIKQFVENCPQLITDEVEKTKIILDNLQETQFYGIFKDTDLKLVSGDKAKFGYFINLNLRVATGTTDIVIYDSVLADIRYGTQIIIDEKICSKNSEENPQASYELLAANIHSAFPVLYIQTDNFNFYFRWIDLKPIAGNVKVMVYRYKIEGNPKDKAESVRKAFEIILKWIAMSNHIKEIFFTNNIEYPKLVQPIMRLKEIDEKIAKFPPQGLSEVPTLITQEVIRNALADPDNCEEITRRSLTGNVIKFHYEKQYYVLKYATKKKLQELPIILTHLKNEARVYKRLAFIKKVLSKNENDFVPWSTLQFAGELQFDDELKILNNEKSITYAIVTDYIYGKTPDKILKSPKAGCPNYNGDKWDHVKPCIKKLCEQALAALNLVGITHNDARIPNFIVSKINSKNKAFVIDFGASDICETSRVPSEDLKESMVTNQSLSITNSQSDSDF